MPKATIAYGYKGRVPFNETADNSRDVQRTLNTIFNMLPMVSSSTDVFQVNVESKDRKIVNDIIEIINTETGADDGALRNRGLVGDATKVDHSVEYALTGRKYGGKAGGIVGGVLGTVAGGVVGGVLGAVAGGGIIGAGGTVITTLAICTAAIPVGWIVVGIFAGFTVIGAVAGAVEGGQLGYKGGKAAGEVIGGAIGRQVGLLCIKGVVVEIKSRPDGNGFILYTPGSVASDVPN